MTAEAPATVTVAAVTTGKATMTNQRGVVMIVVVMVLTLMFVMWSATDWLATLESKKVVNHKWSVKALYLAETGANFAMAALAFSSPGIINTDTTGILGPNATGSVVISPVPGTDRAIIKSTATYFTAKATVTVGVKEVKPSFPGVGAALTANGPTLTNGTITIDGRDHDLDGLVIPGAGGPGLITGETYSQDGTSSVGGTWDGSDYTPTTPADSHVVKEGVAGLAQTPDAVVGFTEGMLEQFARSGRNGSQYVTNPADLQEPLSGVTFVDLSSEWWIVAGDSILNNGTGVLIVHNSAGNAVMKNLNKGTFKGVIIADDIVHIHNTIIGAVISLTSTPSEGNAIGNGSGEVLFSSQVLQGFGWLRQVKPLNWKQEF